MALHGISPEDRVPLDACMRMPGQTEREDSDIDIYYESSHMSLFTLCRLKSELEKLLGCSVDLFCKRESFAGTRMEKSINKDLIYV